MVHDINPSQPTSTVRLILWFWRCLMWIWVHKSEGCVDWLGTGGALLGPSGTWTGIVRELNDFGTPHRFKKEIFRMQTYVRQQDDKIPCSYDTRQISSRSFGRSRGSRISILEFTRDSDMIIAWLYPCSKQKSPPHESPGMVQERTWIALAYASCDAEAGRIEMVLNGGVRHAAFTIYHAHHFVTDIGHALQPAKIPLYK